MWLTIEISQITVPYLPKGNPIKLAYSMRCMCVCVYVWGSCSNEKYNISYVKKDKRNQRKKIYTIELKGMRYANAKIKTECSIYSYNAGRELLWMALRHRFRSQSYGFHIFSHIGELCVCLRLHQLME